MVTHNLKLGGREIGFIRSDKLLAIRSGSDPRQKVDDVLVANGVSLGMDLGPYKIIDISKTGFAVEDYRDAVTANPNISQTTFVYHTSDDEVPFIPSGIIFLKFHDNEDIKDIQELLISKSLQIVEARGEFSVLARLTDQNLDAVSIAADLVMIKMVAIAEPDLITEGQLSGIIVADDLSRLQWYLRNSGSHYGSKIGFKLGADARVMEAWQNSGTLGNAKIVVSIIDDGFDLSHPDLSGSSKIRSPFDFKRGTMDPAPVLERREWHGTACAGVAVGAANGSGIVGAAPNCALMPIRWGDDLSDAQIETWFDYVTNNGASVVSCSWSARARNYPLSTRKHDAIARCATKGRNGRGCVICFAADNFNRNLDDPSGQSFNGFANHPDVITVAASTSLDERSDYSSYGSAVWVCAPSSGAGGWGITTSDVQGEYQSGGRTAHAGYGPGAYTNDFGGTSSACPLVAGISALVLSVNPALSASEVKTILKKSARRIGRSDDYDEEGHSIYFGYGCINAAAACELANSKVEFPSRES